MNTLVIVNGTDITPYMDHKSYDIAPNDVYKSWTDGNEVEHRVYVRSKMKGSFRVWLCGKDGMDVDAFMELWNAATVNHVTTLGVYDIINNEVKAINAYCKLTPSAHKVMSNGEYWNVIDIEVSER